MAEDRQPALASLVRQGDTQTEADQPAPGIFGVRDISNAYLVTTNDGDVMVNTGFMDNVERNQGLLAPHRTGPLKAIVLTQSHADHFGGLDVFAEEGTEVLGGLGFTQNWHEMGYLQPFFGPRSFKLWGNTLNRGDNPRRPPSTANVVEVEDGHAFTVGERRFEVLHTPEGETTDGVTVWLPNEKIAFTGNLLGPVWLSMPFLNTLRGDKPRLVRHYLASLERLRALEPEMVITGHGQPITDAATIRADLDRIHGAVSHIRDATLAGMNAGKSLYELMREVSLPENLRIGELHGKISWAVRAIWHEYSGWFLYESTTELYGVPRSAVSDDLVELAGADALAERAAAHVAEGRPLEALHLTDIVLGVDPAHRGALQAKLAASQALLEASGSTNLSETMWLRSEIAGAEAALGAAGDA